MTNQNQILSLDPSRIIFTIPDFDEFGELLHDRLHAVLYHIEEIDTQFMLITNLFDRDQERIEVLRSAGTKDLESLVYSGTDRQRAILEKKEPVNYVEIHGKDWDWSRWRKERDMYWAALKHRQLAVDMEGVLTFPLFAAFRQGTSKISDIKVGSLKDYFSDKSNVLKDNEKPIISDYFDLERDLYVGIPLLGLGKFQGIVWIIFKQEERNRFEDYQVTKRLLKLFEMEYYNLVFSWEVSGKKSLIRTAIEETAEYNPTQEDARLNQFYKISEYYHDNRLQKNDETLEGIRQQLLRTATITILLDSFAHNISAHSLTALSWWFRERSEYLGEGKEMLEALGRDLNPLIRHYKMGQKEIDLLQSIITHLVKWPSNEAQNEIGLRETLITLITDWYGVEEQKLLDIRESFQRPTLSRELYPLFKFLLEKGAFWSGITRQTNFAGKISSLYSVLWYDFINNPLYLGTIANTEEVLKLHIRITIYEKEEQVTEGKGFKNIKTIKRTSDGILLDGIFGTINLQDFHPNPETSVESRPSIFVEKGLLYNELKPILEAMRAFFPGGVIGKHAFFTLLENEIRNVKHFHGEVLRHIQQEGLTLNISIHERPFDSQNERSDVPYQLLKIGVWLNHPVKIGSQLLAKRIENLDADIITPGTSKPRLGGNLQDKICASMLLTSSFNRPQDNNSAIGQIYYPWIKTAGCLLRNDLERRMEFEVSQRRYRRIDNQAFEQAFAPEAGESYLKKYFHLWKGDDILTVETDAEMSPADAENQARFRFLHLEKATKAQYNHYKAEGIIRILDTTDKPKSVGEAYQYWLAKWMKFSGGSQDIVVDFSEEKTTIGRLTYAHGEVRFENMDQIKKVDKDNRLYATYKKIPQRLKISIAHGSQLSKNPEKLNYRSDGELIRHFCKGQKLKAARMEDEGETFELLEAFAARICIFDHRVHNRMYIGEVALLRPESAIDTDKLEVQIKRLEMYRNNLRLDVRDESWDAWREVQAEDFLNLHFLIIHLSFMESVKDLHGQEYTEGRIIEFIDEQVLQGRPASSVGDDFVLVITTGRGRMLWWDTIKARPEYARFTTFRPIESILSAMEDAMQVADDFNLKFNLTKLLFGS